ncbi:MAG: hypothetical protein JNM89_00985 [Hyphomicrobiaceae bacterium]|nr:hypothetical protein [Hyphomicrobiaceae bacterium]
MFQISRKARFARASLLGLAMLAGSALSAAADTLVLVQGYLGSAGSWRYSGIVPVLHSRGWQDGGHLFYGPDGRPRSTLAKTTAANRLYTIDLPTEAPIPVQAAFLVSNLAYVAAQHPRERIAVVAHSAGGVVARYAAVVDRSVKIDTLVTIATPHLGTAVAEVGSALSESPLGWVAPFFGAGTVNRSQVLYRELWRERPNSLLGWLNRQPHPAARYVSIVRATEPTPGAGDSIAPGWSQDMNAVPALAGRAERIISPGDHGLRIDDGALIADILAAGGKRAGS